MMENSYNKKQAGPGTNEDLYSTIFTRASTRKFETMPLPAETLEQIEAFISNVKPLVPDVELSHKIVNAEAAKGLILPKAPHFLLISGKEHPLRNTCAGFLYQHAVLFMHSIGLAARWLSSAKGKQSDPNHIIGIAFGKPAQPATRKAEAFDRKPLSEIATGTDPRLEAVRLAPSGMNGQPWYFIVENDGMHVYYKERLGGLIGKLYNQTDVDLGIGLCHLAIAGEHEGKPFHFSTGSKDAPIPPKGFTYAGRVDSRGGSNLHP
ncbi:MAG: hypothetical protein LIP06_12320 [Tannerellaceae bacterium]|nr:hypothetical protein [Tannerellaceae bacterium]